MGERLVESARKVLLLVYQNKDKYLVATAPRRPRAPPPAQYRLPALKYTNTMDG